MADPRVMRMRKRGINATAVYDTIAEIARDIEETGEVSQAWKDWLLKVARTWHLCDQYDPLSEPWVPDVERLANEGGTGRSIARELNISRETVWAIMKELRRHGRVPEAKYAMRELPEREQHAEPEASSPYSPERARRFWAPVKACGHG